MESPPPPRVDQVLAMVVEIIVYCVHFSVIVVIVAHRKTVFNSAFYFILLTVCIADLLYFIFVTLLAIRFPSYGFFLQFYLDNMWMSSASHTLSNVLGYMQFIGQSLIAINRFTVFWVPAKHENIWKRRWYWPILIGLPLLVIPTRIPDGGKITFSKNGVVLTYASVDMENLTVITTSIVLIVNGILTAVLSILTVFKCWQLRLNGNVLAIPQIEERMLIFSIVIFCIQMLRLVYTVLRNRFIAYPNAVALLLYLLPFISDLHAWVCSISLVFMSQASRKAYFQFYFGNVNLRKPQVSVFTGFAHNQRGP
uniref:Serpentine receptor class gamma n=1 Tax=Panagrellus redivivus TaxID=6233 RepID=A0A7E4VH79_PANRE